MLSKLTILIFLAFITFSEMTVLGGELQSVVYCGDEGLCSISPDGTKRFCLEPGYYSPAWNPKGKQLVVEAGPDGGPMTLVLIDSNGKRLEDLDKSLGYMRPVWSPDGGHIYALQYDLGPRLGRWDSDGKNFQYVPILGPLGEQGDFQMISFSPSGNRVALLNLDFNQIILAHLKNQAFITEKKIIKGLNYVAESAWLDESHLLFVGRVKEGESAYLWEINVDDGFMRLVMIPKLSLGDFLTLSPDRKSVIICATKDDEKLAWSLWEFTLGSSEPKRLTNGEEDVEPSWGE